MLRWDKTNSTNGPVYITSDGEYIYNLTSIDSLGQYKYTVRTFNPSNGWSLLKEDLKLDGSSFEQGFTGLFVHGGYIYSSEYYSYNTIRRHRLSDGFFDEEWVVILPQSNFQSYYSWCYDWTNDYIYSSVYRSSGFIPKISKFPGYYIDANGSILSNQVGPVEKWNYLKYSLINNSSTGKYNGELLGFNSSTKEWDTLQINIPDSISLNNINPISYKYLKIRFDLSDSTFNIVQPWNSKV